MLKDSRGPFALQRFQDIFRNACSLVLTDVQSMRSLNEDALCALSLTVAVKTIISEYKESYAVENTEPELSLNASENELQNTKLPMNDLEKPTTPQEILGVKPTSLISN